MGYVKICIFFLRDRIRFLNYKFLGIFEIKLKVKCSFRFMVIIVLEVYENF